MSDLPTCRGISLKGTPCRQIAGIQSDGFCKAHSELYELGRRIDQYEAALIGLRNQISTAERTIASLRRDAANFVGTREGLMKEVAQLVRAGDAPGAAVLMNLVREMRLGGDSDPEPDAFG